MYKIRKHVKLGNQPNPNPIDVLRVPIYSYTVGSEHVFPHDLLCLTSFHVKGPDSSCKIYFKDRAFNSTIEARMKLYPFDNVTLVWSCGQNAGGKTA